MPKPIREYIYCCQCECALEVPALRQIDMGTIYVDFAVCEECRANILKEDNPSITFLIEGACLKSLLKTKKNNCIVSLPEEKTT